MWLFVLIILAGAYFQTVIKSAVLNRSFRWLNILLFILPVFFFYYRAAEINLKDFNRLIGDPELLNTICILVIVQEAATLLCGAVLLRRYYLEKKLHFWYYASLVPSALFPVICFLGMVYLFNTCSGMSFQAIAVYFSFGIFLLTGGLAELFRLFEREQLIRWATLTSLVQIFIAMFLPVIFSGETYSNSLFEFNLNMAAGIIFIVAATALFALLSHFWVWRKLSTDNCEILITDN
ncbi:MAG: hypothetical protein WC082_02510 [Victivallales bacterium]